MRRTDHFVNLIIGVNALLWAVMWFTNIFTFWVHFENISVLPLPLTSLSRIYFLPSYWPTYWPLYKKIDRYLRPSLLPNKEDNHMFYSTLCPWGDFLFIPIFQNNLIMGRAIIQRLYASSWCWYIKQTINKPGPSFSFLC